MERDFTYIDDIIVGTKSAIEKNYSSEIFNLGNSQPIDLMNFISILEDKIGKKAIINFEPMQLGDVKTTYANIDHSALMLNYKPRTTIEVGLEKFISWYKKFYA
jgi:Nucleoside-diphosphate-sugar epimerases